MPHPVAEPERSGGGAAGGDGDFSAQRRMRAAKKVVRKKLTSARRCLANWLTVPRRTLTVPSVPCGR